jgi:hypothetical protein
MRVEALSLKEILTKAEYKLSNALGGVCNINIYHELTEGLLDILEEIDSQRFRKELRYNREELTKRSNEPGFTCFMVYHNGDPVAFEFGFNDKEEKSYFSDTAATLIERKGIGSILTVIEALYCYKKGFSSVKMITEEEDQSGRRLKEYWERFGFKITDIDPIVGVEMKLDLTSECVRNLCQKYIGE